MNVEIQALNQQYAIPGHVSFRAGPGALVEAVIENQHATATMTLAGGHVMTYNPRGGQPLLWVSPNASFTIGKAMRGGVPVCWPWFGSHPKDPESKPMHGLVRTMLWSMAGTRSLPDGSTEVRMQVQDNEQTRAIWPHAFHLEVTATIGPRLHVEWTASNPGSQAYTYTGALHPYYTISDIQQITIYGLEGTDYLDKNDNFQRKTQTGPLIFTGPVDCIFLDTSNDITITDPGLGRKIHIAKTGSHTTVVWNPEFMDARMPDVGAGQHKNFVCIEAANAVNDAVTVPPGAKTKLGMEICMVQE